MNERLRFLLRKNKSERDRVRSFDDFSSKLRQFTGLSAAELLYSSFEETNGILSRVRTIKAESTNIGWETATLGTFYESLVCLSRKIPESECHLLLFDNYLPIGAIRLSSKVFLEKVRGFLDLGEDTLFLVNESFEDYLKITRYEDNLMASGYFCSVTVSGASWPKICAQCSSGSASLRAR